MFQEATRRKRHQDRSQEPARGSELPLHNSLCNPGGRSLNFKTSCPQCETISAAVHQVCPELNEWSSSAPQSAPSVVISSAQKKKVLTTKCGHRASFSTPVPEKHLLAHRIHPWSRDDGGRCVSRITHTQTEPAQRAPRDERNCRVPTTRQSQWIVPVTVHSHASKNV